ncbi:N-acetylglucosamine-6-phosphate deacetylase [Shimia marina]|uniref:N-acetylglucosamine-6-phosphate deacetylase n=1 Tax=Shimia marina TaxID=321267 RepID=A0A0P1ELY5_9RHOB|nr:N-acetylglucosamine-6-phosphate deacetylase [Shimia marina]CUH51421.1 N-acetylglucosamine-6-phosphate deacetylase [Shimia marina]SFD49627.1 N-acetylglucosamine 6-phosphate deacetylase [Shimia marina]
MTPQWIAPDLLFDGTTLRAGQALRIAEDVVQEVAPAPQSAQPLAGILTPGYVDLQVNGGGGALLNGTPTRATIATMADAHRRHGTVAILPTVITDRAEVLEDAANAMIAAEGMNGVIGLHIEGPHISEPRKGTHEARFIRPLDDRTMAVVTHLRDIDIPVMITLAPESATLDQISALAKTGAVVSLGHTDATAAQVNAAIAAGASCATHLFNAMSPMTSRAPGAVGAIINSTVFAGIIADGYHVDDSMVGLTIRARPEPDRMMLVSDSMPTIGGPDHFTLYGHDVTLRDGRLINREGTLAGAHITQARGVQRLIHNIGLSPEAALRMAITTPATCIGRPDLATPVGRPLADLLVLDTDYGLRHTLAETIAAE